MTRYFLTVVKIEGFRGIRNENQPLELRLKADAVNSIFAANGLGKSSVFEGISYAITGTVPKLDRMLATESAKDYYCNKFHSQKRAEIELTFTPDDGSKNIVIKVVREANGKRTVTSPSEHATPEAFLATLASETILLDQQTFLKFLLDSPLDRGKAFSSLLGLSKLAEVRQGLSAVANTTAFNTDSNIRTLETVVALSQGQLLQLKPALQQDYLGLVGLSLSEPIDPEQTAATALHALAGVTLLKPLCENTTLDKLDFNAVSTTIKTAEKSDEQEQLKGIIASIAALEGLAPPAGETGELQSLVNLCQAKDLAFTVTRGTSFHNLYAAVRQVFDDGSWSDKSLCPACESRPTTPPYEFVLKQLQQYEAADEAAAVLGANWKSAACASRLRKLEAKLVPVTKTTENIYGKLNATLGTGQATEQDVKAIADRIIELDTERLTEIARLKGDKAAIEGSLPPSLVSLIEQVERAKRIKKGLGRVHTTLNLC